jgi:transcriptional regulator with XRE-family HTH domain
MELAKVNKKIGLVRAYLQLSPAEFAAYLGFTEELIQQVETPGEEIPVKFLQALLEKMNVSTDWILTGKGTIFTKESSLAAPVLPLPAEDAPVTAEKNGFYLTAAELDQRIAALEQHIKDETALPLAQIRALFGQLLNLEIGELPAPAGSLPLERDLNTLPFFEKVIYYQELQRQVDGARQEFLRYFTRLVELTKTNNAGEEGA